MEKHNYDCASIQELLSPYLDGETTATETKAVQEHLQNCADCRAELESLRKLTATCQALEIGRAHV